MTETTAGITRRSWGPIVVAAGVAGVLMAGALALWSFYGTAVFYEMIAAGIAMCF